MIDKNRWENKHFDWRYNDLEKQIMEKGYNKKMIRKHKLRTWEISRNKLILEREATNDWAKTDIRNLLSSSFSKC